MLSSYHFRRGAMLMGVLGGLQFFLLTIIAMFCYPGGTIENPDAVHYLFLENFFSDLGRTKDFNGGSNSTSYIIFTISLCFEGIATLILFLGLSRIFPADARFRFWNIIMVLFGFLAGLGLMGVAFTPWDLMKPTHITFVNVAFCSLLVAILIAIRRIFATDYIPNLYAKVLSFICIFLFAYVFILFFGPDPKASKQALLIQVISQKIIVYLLIFGITFLSWGTFRILGKENVNPIDNK